MRCASCESVVAEDHRFCPRCGARSAAAAPAPASDPLQAALEKALAGRYKLLRMLGRGGMGAVYLAREEALDRLVAIKVIRPESGGEADVRERFKREARTAARLAHPNVVPLHAFGEAEGMLYFVMGFVQGESLGVRLQREARLPVEEARRILAEVADALDYAHRRGVVHRDVKPDNVLLDDETGRAMLTDFGVAKAFSAGETLTRAGGIVGTPHYMSPEQASGQPAIDARSDLYSLGVMGYAMLAGRLPFEGTAVQDVLVQHVTKDPPPLEALAPFVPGDLATAVMRCLSKDPGARWPDAGSLREVLAPGGLPEPEELPVPLSSLESKGVWLLPWAVGLAYLLALDRLWHAGAGSSRPLNFVTLLVLLFPARFLGRVETARHRGFAWPEIARVVFRQPSWWPCAFPRRLRQPGDVWDRLPAATRRLRGLLGVLVVVAVFEGLAVFALLGVPDDLAAAGGSRRAAIVSVLTSLVVWGLPVGLALGLAWYNLGRSWGLRNGLEPFDAYRILLEPTMRPAYWRRSRIARLLAPAPGRVEPRSPRDYLGAIDEALRTRPGAAPSKGAALVEVARRLVSCLEELDAELSRLGRDADPEEARRLDGKLAALGAESASEPEERRQLRQLLSKQRDLIRGLDARLQEARTRRGRLEELLRRLWHETGALTQATGAATAGTAARLRALCAEIAREAGAPGAGERVSITDLPTLEGRG